MRILGPAIDPLLRMHDVKVEAVIEDIKQSNKLCKPCSAQKKGLKRLYMTTTLLQPGVNYEISGMYLLPYPSLKRSKKGI
jgi:hypothetical protein